MSTGHEAEFLRSINIGLDAEAPERINHFRPTSKSVLLLDALLGNDNDSAHFVIAPYGTGKSIAATYLLHLIENRKASQGMLRDVAKRMSLVSPKLAKFSKSRLKGKKSGMTIVLQGYYRSLPRSMKDAVLTAMRRNNLRREAKAIEKFEVEDSAAVIKMLADVRATCQKAGIDRIAILWDEFGKHLESLVTDGRPAALGDIQDIAEFVSRRTKVNVTFGLLLHRDLLQYAANVPHSVRLEWAKIEGRFKEIQYVDDSKEIYRLIAEVIHDLRPRVPDQDTEVSTAKRLKELGCFADFDDNELSKLLANAQPVDPMALYLLPRISSRIAQNERTLFSFLYAADLSDQVTATHLYDYFSPQMRADTVAGGTHRQWLETESALTKVGADEWEPKALKTVCLLGLGLSGERARASKAAVQFGLRGKKKKKPADNAIENLIDQNLLLYRRHADELSVWHGTDIDIRSRLEDEKARQREAFDILDFLRKECPQPVWRPLEYNA